MNKTKYVEIGDLNQDLMLEEDMGMISCTEEYKYLGVQITASGKEDKEIQSRINLGMMTISTLNGILWNKQTTAETKTKICATLTCCTHH